MAEPIADHFAATLQRLRAQVGPDFDATLPDAGASLVPKQRVDTAGGRALAVLSELSTGRATANRALKIERTLGQGGMGVVHLATQVALGRKVAIKTLRPEHRSEATAMQLLREAWVTGALEHPNVVPVYDLGLDADGHPYIVLKRIEGAKWADLMVNDEKVHERFGADDLLEWNLRILMEVCDAIGFAHSRGIVHRDLKPENVMIGEFGEVYVLDWGIAVSLRDDGSGRMPLASEQRELCGTPSYMAPEMLDGNATRLSERTDVYLLGGVLYEILTDHAPHEGETLSKVLTSVLASNPAFPDGAPAELARICRRALAADPDARFENAHQLRLALQGFLNRRGSAQLAAEAERRLQTLLKDLGAPEDSRALQPVERRLHLYNLFGECRFGFQQALRSWRENPAAHDGLLGATTAMIDFELQQGDPKAAALLAGQLPSVPAALRARIEAAEVEHEAARARRAQLEKIGSEYDFSVGQRTRFFLTAVSGTLWTVTPLLWGLRHFYDTYAGMIVMPAIMSLVVFALGVWARDSMSKTAINRALMGAVSINMLAMLLLHIAAWRLQMPPYMCQVLDLFLWLTVAWMLVATLDRRFAIAASGYTLAFAFSCWRPSLVFYVMAVSNGVLTVSMLKLWGRDSLAPKRSSAR